MSGLFEQKATIKAVDMPTDLQTGIISITIQALEKYSVEKDIAAYIKKQMDINYGVPWHVIVGRSFGSFVSHESRHFIYFYIGQIAFLIFKTS